MTVSADKHRNSRLPVMVNTDELALLNLVAEHAGLGTGTWARERLLVAARRELIDYVISAGSPSSTKQTIEHSARAMRLSKPCR